MFGYLIPRDYMEAMQFDSENKNSKWYDAIKLEMESMLEYKVFKKWDKAILDKHKKVMNPPNGYHRIKVHLVFAVKFDGRHKARLVADGWTHGQVYVPFSCCGNPHNIFAWAEQSHFKDCKARRKPGKKHIKNVRVVYKEVLS